MTREQIGKSEENFMLIYNRILFLYYYSLSYKSTLNLCSLLKRYPYFFKSYKIILSFHKYFKTTNLNTHTHSNFQVLIYIQNYSIFSLYE